MNNFTQCLIVGSGPAGYSAAIYAARAFLHPVLIEGLQVGGQLMTTTAVENYPGFPHPIDPSQLMDDMRKQAERFGTTFVHGEVTSITKIEHTNNYKVCVNQNQIWETLTIIFASGASAKYLGIPSEETYKNKGVSACATCDGFFFRGKTVAVVGGGDTACEEALYLANLCTKVYMIVRKPYLRASQILQERVTTNPKISILFEHNTLQLTGENKVQGADLMYRKDEKDEKITHIDIDGFFLAIGHTPNTRVVENLVEMDKEGYLKTYNSSTNCIDKITKQPLNGFFAAGDCADPHYKQAIVAAASGCKAAIDAFNYIKSTNH